MNKLLKTSIAFFVALTIFLLEIYFYKIFLKGKTDKPSII